MHNELWRGRCLDLLTEERRRKPGGSSKSRFLASMLGQFEAQPENNYLPTSGQLRILTPMWAAYQRRQAEAVLGEAPPVLF